MAACKSVVVLTPNARRRTVKVTATSTILQVLEEVCKKQGLACEQFALQHQRKVLDETLPIRYSGLSNNAHLELVPTPKAKKVSTSSTVGLQLESGERLVKEFSPSSSLWDVLTHWDSTQESSHQGKIISPCKDDGKSPVCVYMTQEISSERSLKGTTLHSLGLTGKRAVIRLIHRRLNDKTNTMEDMETSSEETKDVEEASASQSVSDQDPVSLAEDKVEEETAVAKQPQHSTLSSSETNYQDKSHVGTQGSKEESSVCPAGNASSSTLPQAGGQEPKRPRISPPKPYFANFKFPEETAGMNLIQREKADSSRQESLAKPCERQPLVFNETNTLTPTTEEGDLPDSFFDVTVDDLRVMLRDLKNERIQADSAPLMTRAMREVRQESEMYKYEKVVIRVKFPDRMVLQGFFRPMEKVSALREFVKSKLENRDMKFYLYTTPPRRVLDKPNTTLFENKLHPASVVHFGSNERHEHFLAEGYLESSSTVLDAEKAIIETGVLSACAGSRPDIGDQLVSTSTESTKQVPGTYSGGAHSSLEGHNPASSSGPQREGTSKGAIPKWFKAAGK